MTPATGTAAAGDRLRRPPWVRYGRNALSLLGVDTANRAATFVLYALIGRYLGATEFGQMSLALALLYTFQVFAGAGLRTLVTREVASDRSRTAAYAFNGWLVVLATSVLSIAALALFVLLAGYTRDTATIVLLVALGLPAYALTTVCDAVFQAWERMHYSTFSQLPVQIAKVVVGAFLLSRGYGLPALIIVLIASQAVIVMVEVCVLACFVARPALRPDTSVMATLVRTGSTFLGIDALVAVVGSSNVILLSMFADEHRVGLFGAANQLLVPMALVFQNVVLSVFPAMCRRGSGSPAELKRFAAILVAGLIGLAVPAVIGVLFLASPGLLLVYRQPEFAAAAAPLQLMAWTLLLLPLTNVLGQLLVAIRHERVTFQIVAIDVVVNLLAGVLLIRTFGLIGAALTVLVTRLVDLSLHYRAVSRLLPGIRLHGVGWMPAAAGACLAGFLVLSSHQQLFSRIVLGALVYGVAMLLLMSYTAGGPQGLKARYQHLLSDEVA